jgi:uncharacterized protein YgbK (DUF1537 family)
MSILYTYYGDDFTGSTDVLEQLGSRGIPAVLFLGEPSAGHLAAFPDVRAIGIAGDSRSRSPEWMSTNLPGLFRVLKRFGAPVTHYKTCSTFDSSPTLGSIGRAIEIGREMFGASFVPVVVGAPHLRRYVAFGNLFAADADGIVKRIDRHPMSCHPVTPMREADLRVHLAAQGVLGVGLVDAVALESGTAAEAVSSLMADGDSAILFDTIDAKMQAIVGDYVWGQAQQTPIFAAGSSGLTAALISAWTAEGLLSEAPVPEPVAAAKPLLIVSGSCSEQTRRQICYGLANGYQGVAIDPVALMDPSTAAHSSALRAAVGSLAAGRDTIIYTALGSTQVTAHGAELGMALGNLLRQVLARSGNDAAPAVRRVAICGGDTSSHAVQQLGLYALTWVANLQPGGPLCRAHADSELDGLELVLKGGQVGTDDFFDVVRGL